MAGGYKQTVFRHDRLSYRLHVAVPLKGRTDRRGPCSRCRKPIQPRDPLYVPVTGPPEDRLCVPCGTVLRVAGGAA